MFFVFLVTDKVRGGGTLGMYGVQLSSQVWAPKALYSYCLRPICSEEVGMRFFLMRTFRKALRALCYLASLILYLPLCNRIVRATLPTR